MVSTETVVWEAESINQSGPKWEEILVQNLIDMKQSHSEWQKWCSHHDRLWAKYASVRSCQVQLEFAEEGTVLGAIYIVPFFWLFTLDCVYPNGLVGNHTSSDDWYGGGPKHAHN